VALAVISALTQKPVPPDMVVFGEVGLSGEIRAVPQPDLRLKEATKLGFTRALIPPKRASKKTLGIDGIRATEIGHLRSLADSFMTYEEKKC
jgi:DNA repair protein RadA/Sms